MNPPVSLSVLNAVFQNMKGRVAYSFGAKAANLSEDTRFIDQIDCSGFVRYALARATNQALILPDGSSNQHDWADANLRKLAQYSDVSDAPARIWAVCS